jgi:hypothetical protein
LGEPPTGSRPIGGLSFAQSSAGKDRRADSPLTPEHAPEIARATLEKLSVSFSPQQIAILGHDPFGLSESLLNSRFISQEIQSEFSSSDGKFRVIYLEAATPLKNYTQTIAWIQKVNRAIHLTQLATSRCASNGPARSSHHNPLRSVESSK